MIAVTLLCAVPGSSPAMDLSGIQWVGRSAELLLAQVQPTKDKPDNKGPGGNNKKTGTPATKKDLAAEAKELERSKTALPEGYKVPAERLPDIDIKKPLPLAKKPASGSDAAWRKHKEIWDKYRALLQRGNLTDPKAEREILRYGITYRLAEMTQLGLLAPTDEQRENIRKAQEDKKRVDQPETIEHVRDQLLADLDKTNAFNGVMDVRDAFIEILCEEAPKLLDNNFYVRFNIAQILSNINNRDEGAPKGQVEIPGFKAMKALLELVNDSKQNCWYKVHPILALARMCRHKDCKPEDRFAIIECLMNQMTAAKKLPEWYGMRVAYCLGKLGEPYDRTRQPVVVDALMNVLKDTGYSYLVRVQAGHSLGRVPLEGYRKSDDVAVELLRLASQMAVDYQKDNTNPQWRLYYSLVYFSFQPEDATERAEKKGLLGQVDSKPALAATKTVVTEAYQLFIPLAQNALGSMKPEATVNEQLRKIKPWLDAHSKGANGNPVAAGNAR